MSSSSSTTLYEACRKGDVDRIRTFLQSSESVNDPDAVAYMTMLHHAAAGGHAEIIRLFGDVPSADFHAKDHDGWTPLHFAADKGHAECVAALLDLGSDARSVDIARKTPLHYAAASGHVECTKLLLARCPAAATMKSQGGVTPKQLAEAMGQKDDVLSLFP
eukprot:PhM_4_TR16768/c0_g1_i1/m.75275